MPDVAAVALYVEAPLLGWWLAPVSGVVTAFALGIRTGRRGWSRVIGVLLTPAPPVGAMPLALVALSLVALPGRARQG